VTGGGDGIGRGVCRRFAAEGAKVVVAERNEVSGPAVAEELTKEFGTEAFAIRTDVGTKDDVLAMVVATAERFGTIDILVNNAWGGGRLSRVEFKTDNDMAHGFDIGFYGPLWAMQAAFPIMKAQGRGNIINLCSLNGVNAHMGTAEYNSAKEALRSLTRTAAREWARHGIVANVICPAAKSAAFRAVMEANPELVAAADASNPMGRIGDPENDIAPVAVFLASDDARYVTGNTLFVDGGGHINGVAWAPDLPEHP
jgi:NAD(P)-dependent dehydrogenase (short-subunit alcohol dehydrogenase family)